MKNTKKIITLILALVMVMSLPLTASADETTNPGSITIKATVAGAEYEMYKIFDLTYSGTKVAYTIASDWEAFFAGDGAGYLLDAQPEGGSLNQIIVGSATKYINITESNMAEFALAAQKYAINTNSVATHTTATGTGSDVTVSNLPMGYYLIYPVGTVANGSVCSLDSTVPNAEVTIKGETPTIKKEADATTVEVGQKVTFTITGTVPNTTGYESAGTDDSGIGNYYTWDVTDKMSEGLTFNNDVVVKIGDQVIEPATSMYGLTYPEGYTFKVALNLARFQKYVGEEIVITYSATVNEKAINKVSTNEAKLQYSNDPDDSIISQKGEFTPEPVELTCWSVRVIKMDGKTSGLLAGAEFALMNGSNKYYKAVYENDTLVDVEWVDNIADATIVTSIADTNGVEFRGVAQGTYSLVETKAPEGYNALTAPVEFTMNSQNITNTPYTFAVSVENFSGTELPSTGGMGTTLLYVMGGVLVLAAFVLLVTKKRMASAQ